MRWIVLVFVAVWMGAGCRASRPVTLPTVHKSSVDLQSRLAALAGSADADVAIAVADVASGALAAVGGNLPMPQQSTFKLWVVVAAAIAVEKGELSWSDEVFLVPEDLDFTTWRPIEDAVGDKGKAFALEKLAFWMLVWSDNAATEGMLKLLGGAARAQELLAQRGAWGIGVTKGERGLYDHAATLRSEVAKMDEDAAHRHLRATRKRDPNLATARASANALVQLAKGELLSKANTDLILELCAKTETGLQRLPAGLAQGWRAAHKTGTGFDIAGTSLGTNNIGILYAPSGREYAVAVYTFGSRKPLKEQEALIASVAKAVAAHDAQCARSAK